MGNLEYIGIVLLGMVLAYFIISRLNNEKDTISKESELRRQKYCKFCGKPLKIKKHAYYDTMTGEVDFYDVSLVCENCHTAHSWAEENIKSEKT